MKCDDSNLLQEDGSTQLDQNLSRLLKAASSSSRPSAGFTESLVNDAVAELRRTKAAGQNRASWASGPPWLERSLGWAAVVGAACSAGLAIIASILLKMSFLVQAVAVLTVMVNWFTFFGEYLR